MQRIISIFGCVLATFLLLSDRLMATNDGESLYFNTISDKNSSNTGGLSQIHVMSLTQDQRGVMWFGTWYGLNSFDSYDYNDYYMEDGLIASMINSVRAVGDSIFIGTEAGLSIMDLKTGLFTNFVMDSISPFSSNVVNYISEPVNGKLLVCTTIGAYVFNLHEKTFYLYQPSFDRNIYNIRYIEYSEKDDSWWVAANSGLAHYFRTGESFHYYYHNPQNANSLLDNEVTCLEIFDEKNIFIGTKKGLCVHNPIDKSFRPIDLNNTSNYYAYQNEITSLLKYDDNSILVGTRGNGLFHYEVSTGNFHQYKHTEGHSYSLIDDRVLCLDKDFFGNVWIGTYNGVCTIEKYRPKFYTYRANSEDEYTSLGSAVWCMQEISPELFWIGTVSGINVFNRATGECKHLHVDNDDEIFPYNSKVRTLYYDKPNHCIWLGTRYKGVICYDMETKKIIHFHEVEDEKYYLFSSPINSIIDDNEGNVWISTNYGLGCLNKKTYAIKNYFSNPEDMKSLSTNCIYDLHIDGENRLWLTSNAGLMLYNSEDNSFDSFTISESLKKDHPFSSNCFYSITSDSSGVFWLGSRTSGIVSFNPNDSTFTIFDEADGLASNLVYSICVDNQTGDLWASGNKGLSRYNPVNQTVVNYSSYDGLQGDDFCIDAGLVSSSGEMFFGGYHGFNVFAPSDIIMNMNPPKTTIVCFHENGDVKSRLVNDGDTIILRNSESAFGFEFTALDYLNPNKNRYRFCLENHDDNWTERTASRRFAEYFQIEPGNYTFKVMACNSSNIWDEKGVSVTIIILPKWHETWFFRISVTLFILLLVSLIIILIIRNIKNKMKMQEKYHEIEKQMFLLKQKSLQLQMNPHVLFNMLNSIQGYVLRNDSDSAVYYLNKFAMLMRRILSNSTESYISLEKELTAIKLYIELEMMRFDNQFDYEIIVSPVIDVNYLEITPMILQPYVENAIIHGLRYKNNKGHLKITITEDGEDGVLCAIEDNGVGRQRALEIERESDNTRKSFGMKITQERLDMINQYTEDRYIVKVIDLFDNAGKPAGTRVEVRIFDKE